jgi:hypothetical protein
VEEPILLRIKAILRNYKSLEQALESLQRSGVEDYEAYGPTNLAELHDLMPRKTSPIRGIATLGAIAGLGLFFYMCVATALIYNLIVGGKPPWANVPYIIPAYEGTILLGAVSAFIAVLIWARLVLKGPSSGYDPRFSGDDYGVNVFCTPDEKENIIGILKNAGAVEIYESRDR